jgi:DNA-directed RNA polymerase subunit beta
MSFSRIEEVLEMPNLIEVQKNSYKRFLEQDLKEVLADISPITDYSENLVLSFENYYLEETPKYSVEECKERDVNYSTSLKVIVSLMNKETGEIKEQEVFMGDFPLMTDKGTFIINGAERVIVSQLVRSPGVYYNKQLDKTGKELFAATVIPNRGAWLEYETDSNDCVWVRIDRTRKIPVTVLLRAIGLASDDAIINLFGSDERILATLRRDNTANSDEGIVEVYKKLRPGEPPTVDSARSLFDSLFFDPKRYDLARVGRYKFNKKLSLASRIIDREIAETIINPLTGEILAEKGEKITREKAIEYRTTALTKYL